LFFSTNQSDVRAEFKCGCKVDTCSRYWSIYWM